MEVHLAGRGCGGKERGWERQWDEADVTFPCSYMNVGPVNSSSRTTTRWELVPMCMHVKIHSAVTYS